jgi:hypothetical protein
MKGKNVFDPNISPYSLTVIRPNVDALVIPSFALLLISHDLVVQTSIIIVAVCMYVYLMPGEAGMI